MMENKKTKYLLLLTIVAIWGLFGYRLYERIKPKEDHRPAANKGTDFVQKTMEKDSFSLLLNYQDPFMNTFSYRKPEPPSAKTKRKAQKKTVKKPAPPPKPFPEIIYKGNLKLKNGRTIALVAIGGKNVHLGIGESHDEVLVNKIYRDSIRVSYLEEKKTVLRAQL